MIINYNGLELDLDLEVIKGEPPSDDRLYPGTPDTYEFIGLYVVNQHDFGYTDISELWNAFDCKTQEKLIDLWLQAR